MAPCSARLRRVSHQATLCSVHFSPCFESAAVSLIPDYAVLRLGNIRGFNAKIFRTSAIFKTSSKNELDVVFKEICDQDVNVVQVFGLLTERKQKMPKRKRDTVREDEDAGIEDQALRIKVSRLKAKFDQSTKALLSALKLARGFERQKLGRRQKNASGHPQTLLRLREEVIVLKQLQLEQTARNYLLKQLVKTNRIREHPAFEKSFGPSPVLAPVTSNAEGNVMGRLFMSAPVKQVMPQIMKTIYGLLGIDQAGQEKSKSNDAVAKPTNGAPGPESDDEFNGFSSEEPEDDSRRQGDDPVDFGDDIDPAFAEYAKGRLASSSDEESDSEGEGIRRQKWDKSRDLLRGDISLSPTPSEVSSSDEPQFVVSKPAKSVTKTAFLPSLSLGGYYSGSESDVDDGNDYHGPALPQARKNRRGQRARQQLAELKYGKKAKHLLNQQSNNRPSRDDGWDPKRGAVGRQGINPRERPRGGNPSRQRSDDRPTSESLNRPVKPTPKTRDDQGSLHPSWEAAKKRKMQDTAQASFQGKKITFD